MNFRCLATLLAGAVFLTGLNPDAVANDSGDSDGVDTESSWITSIAPAGDGVFVAGSATGLLLRPSKVVRFNGDTPGTQEVIYEHPAAVWSVAATSDGKTIASTDYKGNLVVYNVESKEATTHEGVFERWCQKIVVSPDDQSVIAGNESGKLFVWSLADAKVSASSELGKASITSIAFSPNKKQLAAADGEGKVHLLSYPELESAGAVSISEDTAWCVAYENESSLIVGSGDRNLYRVAAKADAKPNSIAKGGDWITRIAVSDDGQIAASEVSGKIHFASGGSVNSIGAESGVWALCFRGPGQLFVGTRKNGIVLAGQSWEWKPVAVAQPPAEEASDQPEEASDEKPAEESSDGESEEQSEASE